MVNRRCQVAALLLTAAVTVAACGDDTPDAGGNGFTNPPTSTTPFTGTTIQPGEVVRVDNLDGARLHQVEDGVVRSFETSVQVTEFGTATRLGSGDAAYKADGDASLLVFSMTTERNERETPLDGKVVAAVSVDDKQRELPDFSSDDTQDKSEQTSYAVAVPKDRTSVTLDLKYSGVVQSFDLLEGKPTGERPEALYRADRGTVVYQEGLAPSAFDVEVGSQTYANTVTVTRAELGYFPLRGHEMPSAKDKAWLSFSIGLDAKGTTCSVPISAYSFTAEDGTAYQPTQAASEIQEPDLIDTTRAVVAFEVPADLAKGTLTISTPQATCQTSTAEFNPVPAHGTATIAVTLPKS